MKVSFVIPCYRSEATLPLVVKEVEETMERIGKYEFDLVLINDCSPDSTAEVIKKLCEEKPYVHGLSFSRNFGQHAALMAGFRAADGDIVVCLDDDGQTPADETDKLLEKIEEGYDVVYAKYEHKQHSGFRNFGSRVNDLMTRVMLGKPKDLFISSFFAVRRFIVEDMIRYEYTYPYVIGLVLRSTKNIINVPVNHRERLVGTSGYTLGKLLGLWFNGFTAFSIKPLRIASIIGVVSAISGFLYGVFTVIKKFVIPDIPVGFSALMSVVVFFFGIILLILGLIGEYVGRIYISMNNAPQYIIKDRWN